MVSGQKLTRTIQSRDKAQYDNTRFSHDTLRYRNDKMTGHDVLSKIVKKNILIFML